MSRMLDVVGSGEDISALYELEKAEGPCLPNLGRLGSARQRGSDGFLDQWQSLLVEPSGESLVFEEN